MSFGGNLLVKGLESTLELHKFAKACNIHQTLRHFDLMKIQKTNSLSSMFSMHILIQNNSSF